MSSKSKPETPYSELNNKDARTLILVMAMLSHLAVDAACLGAVTASDASISVIAAIVYVTIAFGTQPLVGILVDNKKNASKIAMAGTILVFIGVSIVFLIDYFNGEGIIASKTVVISQLTAILIYGLGNSFFHTGAATIVLQRSDGQSRYIGMFASAGAIGVALGCTVIKYSMLIIPAIAAIGCTSIFNSIYRDAKPEPYKEIQNVVKSTNKPMSNLIGVVVFVFMQIFALSLLNDLTTGIANSVPDISWFTYRLAIFQVMLAVGRFAGGWLTDILGSQRTATTFSLISIVCVITASLISPGTLSMILAFVAVPLISSFTAMGITGMVQIYPDHSGTAFGLTKGITMLATDLGYAITLSAIPITNNIRNIVLFDVIVFLFVIAILLFKPSSKRIKNKKVNIKE